MVASIGEQLRLAREGRGIQLRDICEQTRISVHYLEAIEANDYKRLPGGVFNRSFIKAYARHVGYDEREAIEGCIERTLKAVPALLAGEMDKATLIAHTSKPPRPKPPRPEAG